MFVFSTSSVFFFDELLSSSTVELIWIFSLKSPDPVWVAIKNPSSLLLLPSHYKVIYETIENLHRIERNELQVDFEYITKTKYNAPPNINEDIQIEIEFVINKKLKQLFSI